MKYFKFFFQGEFLFAAFILSTVFKSALPEFPIDLNVVLFVLTFLIAMKRLFLKPYLTKRVVFSVLIFICFVMIALMSLIYSSSIIYSTQKALILLSLTLWSFVGTFLLINSKASLNKFLLSFMNIAIVTSVYVFFDYYTSSSADTHMRIGIDGGNSLGLGRAAGLGIIVIIMTFLFNEKVSIFKKIISFLGLLILLLVLFLTGSRMALISLGIVLVLFLLIKIFKVTTKGVFINKSSVKVALWLVLIPLSLTPFSETLQTMIARLGSLFNKSGVGSYSQRTELFSLAYKVWRESPFLGDGLGSYAIHYNGIDERYYPHNIILEILAELGLLGLVFFVALLFIPFFFSNIFKSNYLQMCVLLMFIYIFLNANTTGDINDNRMLFTFLALLYMYPFFNTESKEMF